MEPDSSKFIELSTPDGHFRINPEQIDTIVRTICSGLGLPTHEVSWDFVDSGEMQTLNQQYRNKDRSTDVLSFPQEEWNEALSFHKPAWPLPEDEWNGDAPPQLLGDVIISPSDALHNAKNIGHGLDRETAFLLVHGILHLCGHDHMESVEEERMTTQQQQIMQFLESIESQPLWADCITVEG